MERFQIKSRLLKNLILLFAGIFILSSGIVIVLLASLKIPDFHSFEDRKVANSTQIYDRTGKILLYDIHQDIKRTDIPFEQMSLNIKNATVAIEDSEFYNHGGIRPTSIVRAIFSNIFGSGKTQWWLNHNPTIGKKYTLNAG